MHLWNNITLIWNFIFQHLPVIQCSTIVRCRSCRTYINPFVYFVDHKRWKCNLCFRVNERMWFVSVLINKLKQQSYSFHVHNFQVNSVVVYIYYQTFLDAFQKVSATFVSSLHPPAGSSTQTMELILMKLCMVNMS